MNDAATTTGKRKRNNEASGQGRIPDLLPLIALPDQVVFPGSAVPLRIANARDKQLVSDVAADSEFLAMVAMKEDTEEFSLNAAYDIGCAGRLMQIQPLPDGSLTVII